MVGGGGDNCCRSTVCSLGGQGLWVGGAYMILDWGRELGEKGPPPLGEETLSPVGRVGSVATHSMGLCVPPRTIVPPLPKNLAAVAAADSISSPNLVLALLEKYTCVTVFLYVGFCGVFIVCGDGFSFRTPLIPPMRPMYSRTVWCWVKGCSWFHHGWIRDWTHMSLGMFHSHHWRLIYQHQGWW